MRIVALALLLLIAGLAYAPVRSASFVYEDANAIWQHPGVTGHAPIDVTRARWLSALSHRVVFTAFGPGPRPTHLANLAIHLVNGGLVYAIAALWVAPAGALLAAAVFLLHPLQTEAIAYAASRSELLSTCCALVAFLIAWHARRWWHVVALWTVVLAALCAKESTVVIIPLIALVDVFRGRRLSWWRLSWLAVPAGAMAVSVLRFDFLTRTTASPLGYLALQATALWRYMAIVAVPMGQSVDHDFVLVPLVVQGLAFGATVLLLALAFGAVWVVWMYRADLDEHGPWPAGRVACLGLVWAAVALLPRFAVQIPELLNEHQMYLPFVGISVALGAALSAWATAPHAHLNGTLGMTSST
jgi:hypothetical protein